MVIFASGTPSSSGHFQTFGIITTIISYSLLRCPNGHIQSTGVSGLLRASDLRGLSGCIEFHLKTMLHSHLRVRFPGIQRTKVVFEFLSNYQYRAVIKSSSFELPLLISLFPSLKLRCLISLTANCRKSKPPIALEQFQLTHADVAARLPPAIFRQLHQLVSSKAGLRDSIFCTRTATRFDTPSLYSNVENNRKAARDFLLRISFYS